MQTVLNEEDEDLIVLELICEELNVQLKLVLELIARHKQEKPHLEQQFTTQKEKLLKLFHGPHQFNKNNHILFDSKRNGSSYSFIKAKKSIEKLLEHFWKEISLKLNRSGKNNYKNLIEIKVEPTEANSNKTPAQANQKLTEVLSQRSQSLVKNTKVRKGKRVGIFTREKRHSFKKINKDISTPNEFEIRNRNHTPINNKFESDWKSKTFNHKRIHSKERPFECKQCEKKFTQSHNLSIHKRIHTGVKPFKCDQCDYKCTRSDSLTVHKRIHTGERPFECNQCEKKLTTSSNLTDHKRTHTGEKPFHCDRCEYKCRTSSSLTRHRRIHTFECDQ